ncbi:MAG: MoaD/ThiS family protein [Bacteroidota bacterium]
MPTVKFTSNLKRFYPELDTMKLESSSVADVIEEINLSHKGIKDYIVDETGALRKHVHIFIGEEMIKDRLKLKDMLKESDEVYIMQALSGG